MEKSENHWSKAKESGTLLGMKSLLIIYRVFGRLGFRIILLPVMAYYYLMGRTARQASQQYLKLVKPYLAPDEAKSLTSFKHFLMFGEIMLDKFLVWMGEISREDVVFETPAVLARLDGQKEGGIIIVSHLGNAEVCNALGQQLPGIRLTVLVNTQHAEKFNSLMKRVNSSPRIKMLQVTEMSPATAMVLSERIDEGEFIVIAGDRTPSNDNQTRVSNVQFLGRTAPMPQGAFILASLLKCPVYVMFCLKKKATYHIYVELFSERLKFSRKHRQQAITEVVQSYAARLEYYCKKAPLQWFNFFDFWGDRAQKNEHHDSTTGR